MIDEASNSIPFEADVFLMTASFSAVVAAEVDEESGGYVGPFEVGVAYCYWTLTVEES
jgi:hypothetical protein